jgi:hypothetical protein
MLQWWYMFVASACLQCFICFSDVCYNCIYFNTAYVSHLLRLFLYEYCVFLQWFSSVFCNCCSQMFQMFHPSFLYVVSVAFECFKVYRVLHMGCVWQAGGDSSGSCTACAPCVAMRDAGAGEWHLGSAGSCVDARKRNVVAGIRPFGG